MNVRNYISLKSKSSLHHFTIIDGQPYYQSTGTNGSFPGIWFPIIMVRGTKSINLDKLPENFNKKEFLIDWKTYQHSSWIIKELQVYRKNSCRVFIKDVPDEFVAKIPSHKTLITSARLSGHLFPQTILHSAGLTATELKLVSNHIPHAKKPTLVTENADEINLWLENNGAQLLKELIGTNNESKTPICYASKYHGAHFQDFNKMNKEKPSTIIQKKLSPNPC